MKKITMYLPLLAMVVLAITFTSCKKETKATTTKAADDSVNSKDKSSVSNAIDATSDDAAAVAGQVGGFAGKTSGNGWYMLCGETVNGVDTGTGSKITITYDNSTNCKGVIRSGTITLTLAAGSPKWSQKGAVVNVVINNVKVTDVATGNSFTLNGTHSITNETGGLAWELFWQPTPGASVSHRDRSSNMTVTFSDGSTASWSVDRTRTWSAGSGITANVITFTVTSENTGSEDSWGTNRFGEAFTSTISSPLSANDYSAGCYWRPYTGKYVYNVAARNATASITFGVDANDSPNASATTCATGYYLAYTGTYAGYPVSLHYYVGF